MKTIIEHNTTFSPFLKWAGNKQKLDLRPYLTSEYNSYYEPFLGSGAVYLKYIAPRQAYLSDVNPRLIATFQIVRDRPDELIELLKEYKDNHSPEFFQLIKDQHFLEDPLLMAARLIYLTKTSYNGLYRENSKGIFNVPIGDYDNPLICDPDRIKSCSLALQDTIIECKSYIDAVSTAEPGDLVYFDPPYYDTFTAYSKTKFNKNDQIQLRDLAVDLVHNNVEVILSNSDNPFTRELYSRPEFVIHTIPVRRSISCKSETRGTITELLICSAPLEEGVQDERVDHQSN